VGAITPFNFPLNLVCHKIGPALAAGCPVVLKPSEKARLTAARLAEILVEAGVPAGHLNVVTGDPAQIVTQLQDDPRVAVLTFTGSSRVGWGIKAASPRKRHILELGSTTAIVVLDDADVDAAAQAAFESALTNSGQACISAQRVFATPGIYPTLLERLTTRFDAAVAGDPRDAATLVGPLITDKDVERIRGWIDAAVASGARVLSGGTADGSVLRPTLLADAPPDALVLCAEVFGPVLTVVAVDDADAAVAAVNSADFGLNAAVFTASLDAALSLGRRIESGTVLVNVTPSFRADEMPYGGVKDSGQGREGVPYAVAELTEQKLLVLRAVAA
jgi:acyl-CoA reductase-like NAD-dependent aldehyde dehydrogenase